MRKEPMTTEVQYFSRIENRNRSRSRDTTSRPGTGRLSEMSRSGAVAGIMDSTKSRVEVLIKKVTLMATELSKIYQSLQNCAVIISDWRSLSQRDEAAHLKLLLKKAQTYAENSGAVYMQEVFKIKEEANKLCADWSRQIGMICTRLESLSFECKGEITRKATELLHIKNEMDQFDPSHRIPVNLQS